MFVNLKRKAVVPDKFRVHVHPVPTIPETGNGETNKRNTTAMSQLTEISPVGDDTRELSKLYGKSKAEGSSIGEKFSTIPTEHQIPQPSKRNYYKYISIGNGGLLIISWLFLAYYIIQYEDKNTKLDRKIKDLDICTALLGSQNDQESSSIPTLTEYLQEENKRLKSKVNDVTANCGQQMFDILRNPTEHSATKMKDMAIQSILPGNLNEKELLNARMREYEILSKHMRLQHVLKVRILFLVIYAKGMLGWYGDEIQGYKSFYGAANLDNAHNRGDWRYGLYVVGTPTGPIVYNTSTMTYKSYTGNIGNTGVCIWRADGNFICGDDSKKVALYDIDTTACIDSVLATNVATSLLELQNTNVVLGDDHSDLFIYHGTETDHQNTDGVDHLIGLAEVRTNLVIGVETNKYYVWDLSDPYDPDYTERAIPADSTYKMVLELNMGDGMFAIVGQSKSTSKAYIAIIELDSDTTVTMKKLIDTGVGDNCEHLAIGEPWTNLLVFGGDCPDICVWNFSPTFTEVPVCYPKLIAENVTGIIKNKQKKDYYFENY